MSQFISWKQRRHLLQTLLRNQPIRISLVLNPVRTPNYFQIIATDPDWPLEIDIENWSEEKE